MCYDENNAEHVLKYLNAQLAALHEAAVDCFQRHGEQLKPEVNYRYSYAFAKFYYGKHRTDNQASIDDLLFYASFNKPTIDFVCNHEALLRFNLSDGHYNADYARATDFSTANKERNVKFSNVDIEFRVPFRVTGIRGGTNTIGNGEHVVSLFIFDYKKAQLSRLHTSLEPARQAMITYMPNYFQLLQSAGHHVLFSLPEFGDLGTQLIIDFSENIVSLPEITEIRGISIERINAYLSTSWLKAAMLAGTANSQTPARKGTALAEVWSSWLYNFGDQHFHIKFAAPRVKALCNDELIITFYVDEALIYESENFDTEPIQVYSEWEFAILVGIAHESIEGDKVTRFKLDLHENHRFLPQFSKLPDRDTLEEDEQAILDRLIQFFSSEYLTILEDSEYHVIFHYDVRWPEVGGMFDESLTMTSEEEQEEGDWAYNNALDGRHGRVKTKFTAWREITQSSNMCGYDQITAISQFAINSYFHSMSSQEKDQKGDAAIFAEWTQGEFFHAKFKPLTIRLLSSGTVLIWVQLQEGYLKTLRNRQPWSESEKHPFAGWRLAFEVPIRMCERQNLKNVTDVWTERFKQSQVYKDHPDSSGCVFNHIYLDLEKADFIQEFSKFDGLFAPGSKRPIDKVQAIVKYMRDYFFELVSGGYHVLHTIPVWGRQVSAELPPYSLTSVLFHVYSKDTITRQTFTEHMRSQEPAIVIVGMGSSRPMPLQVPQFPSEWIARAGKSSSYGTVCISTRIFLEDRLLRHLARVNAATTVLPVFAGIEGDRWRLELMRLSDHPTRNRLTACDFLAEPLYGDVLRYKWALQDNWTYEHTGSKDIKNGIYTVHCETQNMLEVPTVFKQGAMEIKLTGQVHLHVSFGHYVGHHVWEATSSAHWSAALTAYSDAGGLRISVMAAKAPEIQRKTVSGSTNDPFIDPEELLRSHFSIGADLNEVLTEFKIFEGSWKSCYPGMTSYRLAHPIFNQTGDILFELRSDTASASGTQRAKVNGSSPTSDSRHKQGNNLKPRGVYRHFASSTTTHEGYVNGGEDGRSTPGLGRQWNGQNARNSRPSTPLNAHRSRSHTPLSHFDAHPPPRSRPHTPNTYQPNMFPQDDHMRNSPSPSPNGQRSPPLATPLPTRGAAFNAANILNMDTAEQRRMFREAVAEQTATVMPEVKVSTQMYTSSTQSAFRGGFSGGRINQARGRGR